MARLARLEIPGGWYHIINRGHQRRAIFRDRGCYEDFLKRLGSVAAKVRSKDPQLRPYAQPLPRAGGTWSTSGAIGSHALAQYRVRDLV
jgi:hypothetical protein